MSLTRSLFFLLLLFSVFIFSCSGNEADQQKKIDSMLPEALRSTANAAAKSDSAKQDSMEEHREKPFKLSKADSIKVADSVARTKNPVRDFE